MSAFLDAHMWPCTKCEEHFATQAQQAQHLQTQHASPKPWLCQFCPEACRTSADLTTHKAKAPFHQYGYCMCPKCGKNVVSKHILERHKQHDHQPPTTGLDLRSCQTCGFENESYLGLSTHMLHEHAVRYPCEWCEETFVKKEELFKHKAECLYKPLPRMPSLTDNIFAPRKRSLAETGLIDDDDDEDWLGMLDLRTPKPFSGFAGFASLQKKPSRPLPTTPQEHERAGGTTTTDPDRLRFFPPPAVGEGATFATQLGKVRYESPTRIHYGGLTFNLHVDFNPATVWETIRPSKETYRECPPPECVSDELLFRADPKMIAYGNFLRLATTHSNTTIMLKANENRPKPVFRSVQAVESRLTAAYKHAAAQLTKDGNTTTVEEVKQWLSDERKQAGIYPRVVGPHSEAVHQLQQQMNAGRDGARPRKRTKTAPQADAENAPRDDGFVYDGARYLPHQAPAYPPYD